MQTAARLITWRQVYKVLGMEKLSNKELFNRSRPRMDCSESDKTDGEAAESADKQNRQTDADQCMLLFNFHLVLMTVFVTVVSLEISGGKFPEICCDLSGNLNNTTMQLYLHFCSIFNGLILNFYQELSVFDISHPRFLHDRCIVVFQ